LHSAVGDHSRAGANSPRLRGEARTGEPGDTKGSDLGPGFQRPGYPVEIRPVPGAGHENCGGEGSRRCPGAQGEGVRGGSCDGGGEQEVRESPTSPSSPSSPTSETGRARSLRGVLYRYRMVLLDASEMALVGEPFASRPYGTDFCLSETDTREP